MPGRRPQIQLFLISPVSTSNFRNTVDLISKKLHTDAVSLLYAGKFQNIPVHPERSSLEIHLIACILHINESLDHIVTVILHARPQRYHHVHIIIRTSESVNAGNGCHNDHISTLRQGRRRRQAQFIDLIIDRRILRNIGVRLRHISFRLIIVVVGYKVFYRIFREKFLNFPIKLPGKCLIM